MTRKKINSKLSPSQQPNPRVVRTYYELRKALCELRVDRGYSQLEFDSETGVCQSLTAKIESGYRSYGEKSLSGALKALGLVIVVVDANHVSRFIDKPSQDNQIPSREEKL